MTNFSFNQKDYGAKSKRRDEERAFFSVILPIHRAFVKNADSENSIVIEAKSSIKRKTREEIDKLILSTLTNKNMSANELYRNLGYSGTCLFGFNP